MRVARLLFIAPFVGLVALSGCGGTVTSATDMAVAPDQAKPDLQMPDLQMPDLQMPDLQMRDLQMPDLQMPDLQMPDLQMPDLQMPDLQMPDLQMPDLQMPDLQMPDLVPPPPVRLDVLFSIDNSVAMADKRELLGPALARFALSFANPPCIDANGAVALEPAAPTDLCPQGSARRFAPVDDMHVGVISSSLGGLGSDACPAMETSLCSGVVNTSNDDRGELLSRTGPCDATALPTWNGKGFAFWDPRQSATPPGENSLTALGQSVQGLVAGVGARGCGYPSQLESVYRFLVDPAPYDHIEVSSSGQAMPVGTDSTLLAQRADFLRPDSMVVIVLVTGSDDCSVRAYAQYYLATQQLTPGTQAAFHLPRARAECATNPGDPCCRSCNQSQTGCPADPGCLDGALDDKTDPAALRCWNEKQRFGIDFLYPLDRYVNGLSAPMIADSTGAMVENPLFAGGRRDPGLVYLDTLAGVPWQDLARDPTDLASGYKNAAELAQPIAGSPIWDYLVGDAANNQAPLDPHMVASNQSRSGVDPITQGPLAPPSMTGSGSDPISGHEYTPGTMNGVQLAADALEYACIYPLATTLDCSDPTQIGCVCTDPKNDNPLCTEDPNNGNRTIQSHAPATPGLRLMSLVEQLGAQGIPASLCAPTVTPPEDAWLAAIHALHERVASRLTAP